MRFSKIVVLFFYLTQAEEQRELQAHVDLVVYPLIIQQQSTLAQQFQLKLVSAGVTKLDN